MKNGAERKQTLINAFWIIAPSLLILGFLYLLGGIHETEWENNVLLEIFPTASKYLIIPIDILWNSLDKVTIIGTNGKFGYQLITIAFILIYIFKADRHTQENNALKWWYTVSKIICVFIVIWHGLIQLINDKDIFHDLLYYSFAFVICYVTGRIVGSIIKAIMKKAK